MGFGNQERQVAKAGIDQMRRALNPRALNTPTAADDNADVDAGGDELRIRYEMELAAHSDTKDLLVAAKDELIQAQREISRLRAVLSDRVD